MSKVALALIGLAGTQAQLYPEEHLFPDPSNGPGRSGKSAADCSDRGGFCADGISCKSIYIYTGNDSEEEIYACTAEEALAELKENAIEKWMINDDLGQMMMELEKTLTLRTRNVPEDEVNQGDMEALHILRKFKNLKAMVMTLQPVNVTVFGRYCYYGCWCLPNGMHNLAAGYGAPADQIDEVCREFAHCYKCLTLDFGGTCDPEERAYRWGRVRDGDGIVVDLRCKDCDDTDESSTQHIDNCGPTHRCKRYACECDRVLAVGLSQTHWYWNESHHSRWGDFNREEECYQPCEDCIPVDDCCGAYGSASTDVADPVIRRPYATASSASCCQDVYFYDSSTKECCNQDGAISIESSGDCAAAGGVVLPKDELDDFGPDLYAKK